MKKIMIIAALVSVMLIPAQMEANNKVNNKARIEYNKNSYKKFDNRNVYRKLDDRRGFDKKQAYYKKDFNKKKVYKKRIPARPGVVVAKKPALRPRPYPRPYPRQVPPPPPPVRVVYIY